MHLRRGLAIVNREIDNRERNFVESLLELAVADFFDLVGKSWGIRNPIDTLRECIRNKEWFKGVVLSAAFLEGIGARVLSFHFANQIDADKIEHLGLNGIIMFLYASNIIDQTTYSKMMDVKKYRNDLVHRKEPFAKLEIQPKESKRIIEKAIKCLSPLIFEFHQMDEVFLKRNKEL